MAWTVYTLQHVNVKPGGWRDTKGIGTYTTMEKAEAAWERARHWPGFCDAPDGFEIHARQVDTDGWLNGEMNEVYG